ncbi:MAG: ribonuclease P protein component [Synergistaceae bacterium]|nr:ribonuclease P protein component [Synergistaceae bacterium]
MQSNEETHFTFSSEQRLRFDWQFDKIFRIGLRENRALVRLLFLKGEQDTRVGVTVSKHIAHACGRTHGRRILREACRHLLPYLEDGLWVCVSLTQRGLASKTQDIYREMVSILKKKKLLKESFLVHKWQTSQDK